MIVFADFDGTLTIEDVTTLLWDAHLPYDWRARFLPATYAGELTPFEMIARGYRDVPVGPDALLTEIRPQVRLRPGLDRLARACAERGAPLHVVSHGLSFYIRAMLPPQIPSTSFDGEFRGGRWSVSLPEGITLEPGEDFKTAVISRIRSGVGVRVRATPVAGSSVYLGDGRLDLPAARACDRVFAVRGSTLERLLAAEGRPVESFETLDEVAAALARD